MNWFQTIRSQVDARLAELDSERQDLLKILSLLPGSSAPHTATIAEDVSRILRTSPVPLPVPKIYDKLVEQGRQFKGKNPKLSVYITMTRKPNLFKKLNGGWALANKGLDL